jgi:hypothetical protein
MLDASCRAYVHVPECQIMSFKASTVKLGAFEYYGVSATADGDNMEMKTAADKEFRWFNNSCYLFYPLKKQQCIGFGKTVGGTVKLTEESIYKSYKAPENMAAEDFRPVKVRARYNAMFLENHDGAIYIQGTIDDVKTWEKLEKIKYKAADIH